jgi:hypothetical protein
MLDRVLVGGIGAKTAPAAKAQQPALRILDADDGKSSCTFGLEPADHVLCRARLVVVERRGVDDGIVENVQNRSGVAFVRALHDVQITHFLASGTQIRDGIMGKDQAVVAFAAFNCTGRVL